MPKVSIGLPVYNGEKYSGEAIESILNQTFTDFELIISDNASEDNTKKICSFFAEKDCRIKYYRNIKNIGASKNYNMVFKYSSGEYFKWIAHDDICAPNFIAECLSVLEVEEKVVLAFPKTLVIDENSKPKFQREYQLKNVESKNEKLRFREILCANHVISEIFGLIRSDILSGTNLIGSFSSSDRVLLAELSLYGPFAIVNKPLFHHREHDDRSHKALKNPHERVAWFDTSKANEICFPAWRVLAEAFKSIKRSKLTLPDKIITSFELFRWVKKKNRLIGDIIIGYSQMIKKAN